MTLFVKEPEVVKKAEVLLALEAPLCHSLGRPSRHIKNGEGVHFV